MKGARGTLMGLGLTHSIKTEGGMEILIENLQVADVGKEHLSLLFATLYYSFISCLNCLNVSTLLRLRNTYAYLLHLL